MTTPVPTVLLANEPRSYREVLAMAIEASRPGLAVHVGEPACLEDAIERWQPRLVVCSSAVETARQGDTTWLTLYPDGARFAVASRGTRRDVVGDLPFDELLNLVDSALTEPTDQAPLISEPNPATR